MRFIFNFIFGLIAFIFRTIFRLIRMVFLLLVVGAVIIFILVQTRQVQLTDITTPIGQFFQTNPSVQGAVDSLSDFVTDHAGTNSSEIGRWRTNTATVYIDTDNPTYQTAYQDAIANWNATGVFTFQITNDKSQAQIIATSTYDQNSRAAGVAQTHTDNLTGYFIDVTVKLNDFYLMNPSYGYGLDRITHTAEHELGHAIGLSHNDQESSVMESAGSNTGIQATDIEHVRELYTS